MANIDDELLLEAEEDARAVAFIKNNLPQELKEKFSEDELYYFLDVIAEYYTNNGTFDVEPDEDGYIDIYLDKVVDYVIKQAKKDEIGTFEHDEILFVVQAELDFNESGEE